MCMCVLQASAFWASNPKAINTKAAASGSSPNALAMQQNRADKDDVVALSAAIISCLGEPGKMHPMPNCRKDPISATYPGQTKIGLKMGMTQNAWRITPTSFTQY
jgi:hypothetical protein